MVDTCGLLKLRNGKAHAVPGLAVFDRGKGPGICTTCGCPKAPRIEDSGILSALSYYKLSVPVAPLPRALNEEAVRAGSAFCRRKRSSDFLPLPYGVLWDSGLASE
jgi:hypothetical protein